MLRGTERVEYTIQQAEQNNPNAYNVRGPGLHSGLINEVTLEKHESQPWLSFVSNIEGVDYMAPALWSRLSGTTRSTALVMRGGAKQRFELRTVEHFLASAYIYDLQGYKVKMKVDSHIDHVLEIPILDGSSKDWSYLRFFESNSLPKFRPIWLAVKDFMVKDEQKKVLLRASEDQRCIS